MNRRKLVFAFIAVAAVSVLPNTQAFSSNFGQIAPITNEKSKKKVKTLKSGEVYETEPDTLIELPFHPKDQDHVNIIVNHASVIEYYENRILGKRSSLRLDTLAIIKLTYHSATNNWRLN